MIAGYGQEFAVGRIVERGNHRGASVHGRVGGVVFFDRGGRRVVDGPLGDPLLNEVDVRGREGFFPLRHFGLALLRRDQLDEIARFRLAGDDRRGTAFASFEQAREVRHLVVAGLLRRLMAALALALQDGAHLLMEADLGGRRIRGAQRHGERGGHRRGECQSGKRRQRASNVPKVTAENGATEHEREILVSSTKRPLVIAGNDGA